MLKLKPLTRWFQIWTKFCQKVTLRQNNWEKSVKICNFFILYCTGWTRLHWGHWNFYIMYNFFSSFEWYMTFWNKVGHSMRKWASKISSCTSLGPKESLRPNFSYNGPLYFKKSYTIRKRRKSCTLCRNFRGPSAIVFNQWSIICKNRYFGRFFSIILAQYHFLANIRPDLESVSQGLQFEH